MSTKIIYTQANTGVNTWQVDTVATSKAAAEAKAIAETTVKAKSPAKTVDFTKGYLRVNPESKTYASAQKSNCPLAYILATHAATGILRRDKSLQWDDALQTVAWILLEAGVELTRKDCQGRDIPIPLPADGVVRLPSGLVSVIKRTLKLQGSPVNGLTRGKDSHESAERKKTRDRLASAAKRLRENPMAIARKAIAYNLFPTLNAIDIYRRLEDLKTLNGHDWRKAVSYAMPKISAKGLTHLAEAPGTTPIKSVIYGPDNGNPAPFDCQSYGYGQ